MPSSGSNPKQTPSIDKSNPLYCPTLSPALYLNAIKNSIESFRRHQQIQYPANTSGFQDVPGPTSINNKHPQNRHVVSAGGNVLAARTTSRSALAMSLAKSHFKFVQTLYRSLAPSLSQGASRPVHRHAPHAVPRLILNLKPANGTGSAGRTACWSIAQSNDEPENEHPDGDVESGEDSGCSDWSMSESSASESQDPAGEDDEGVQELETYPSYRLLQRQDSENTENRLRSVRVLPQAQSSRPQPQPPLHPPLQHDLRMPILNLKRKRQDSASSQSYITSVPSRRRKGVDGEVVPCLAPDPTQQLPYARDHELPQARASNALERRHEHEEILALRESLYGPQLGAESPRSMGKLASLIAGLLYQDELEPARQDSSTSSYANVNANRSDDSETEKLRRLIVRECVDHQDIIDLLGEMGLITPPLLRVFRSTEIEHLDLSASICNLVQHSPNSQVVDELFKGLSEPNSYLCLTYLSLSNSTVRIQPGWLIDVISLRSSLRELHMNNCQLTNEGIFILTALASTLRGLSIAGNEGVNDDAAPALALFRRLVFLDIEDTSITMRGLRILARSWMKRADAEEGGEMDMDVRIPEVCERYLDSLETQYLIHIPPSSHLTSYPCQVDSLALEDVKLNLEAHARWNEEISVVGSEREMRGRLRAVLEMREEDLRIAGMCV